MGRLLDGAIWANVQSILLRPPVLHQKNNQQQKLIAAPDAPREAGCTAEKGIHAAYLGEYGPRRRAGNCCKFGRGIDEA